MLNIVNICTRIIIDLQQGQEERIHVYIYNEISISNKEAENVWLDREFEAGTPAPLVRWCATLLTRSIYIHGPSRPNYHIPPFTKFLPFKKITANTMFTLSGLIELINACIVKAPNVLEKKANLEINNFSLYEGHSKNTQTTLLSGAESF